MFFFQYYLEGIFLSVFYGGKGGIVQDDIFRLPFTTRRDIFFNFLFSLQKGIECHWRNIGSSGRRARRLPANRHSCVTSTIVVTLFQFYFHVLFFFQSLLVVASFVTHTHRKVFNSLNYLTMSYRATLSFIFNVVLLVFLVESSFSPSI